MGPVTRWLSAELKPHHPRQQPQHTHMQIRSYISADNTTENSALFMKCKHATLCCNRAMNVINFNHAMYNTNTKKEKLTKSLTSSRLTMPLRPVDFDVTHNHPSPMSLRTMNISPGMKLFQHQKYRVKTAVQMAR